MNPNDTFGSLKSKFNLDCGIILDLNEMEFKGKKVSDNDSLINYMDCTVSPESELHASIESHNDLTCSVTLHCLVQGCEKSQVDNPTKSFFLLPSEKDRYHHWLLVCKRSDLIDINNVSHNYAVCEDHFIEDHFVDKSKQELKQDAIPTIFPFNHYNSFLRMDGEDDILTGGCEVLIKEEIPEMYDNTYVDFSELNPEEILDYTSRLCRLCATVSDNVLYIYGDAGQKQELAQKINTHLPITVEITDPLPKQLCATCVFKVNLCHEFAETCTSAQHKLVNLNRKRCFMTRSVMNTLSENFPTKDNFANLTDNGMVVQNCTKSSGLWDVKNSLDINNHENDNVQCTTYCCPLCAEGNMTLNPHGRTELQVSELDTIENPEIEKLDESFINNCDNLYNIKCNIWDSSSSKSVDYEVSQEDEEKGVVTDLQNENIFSDVLEKSSCCICGHIFETVELCVAHSSSHFDTNVYPCSVCNIFFTSLTSFQSHCEKNHNDPAKVKSKTSKRVACNLCGKKFNSEKTLRNHSCGSSPRPFKCEECGKYFLTEMRLIFHQQVHQGGSAVTCEYCGKIFSRENNLFDHVRLVHMGEKAHCCDQCGKTFQLKARLIAHQRVHTGERPFECDICGGKFYDKATLKGHRVTHLDVKPFQCEKCGRCFARKTLFKQHTSAHLSEECKRPRTYACRMCGGMVFSSYAKLIEHRKDIHPEAEMNEVDDSSQASKPFKCEDCGKSFAYRVTLVAHRRNHTGELPFQCEFCSKRFSQKRSLVLHRRTHTGEKPFVCLECGKRFVQSAHLYSHTRLHTGEKPYSCDVCGESFRLKDVRDAHQRKHTGERPFKCNVCGKAFRTSHSYYQHMWIHQGKKPYPCTYCGKAFRRSNGLKIHIRIHTGEKPHSCDICGRSFAQKQDMKKHRNLHVVGKL